jgi:myo-inositol catabolism protein IolC
VPKERAGILVDEQFGSAILRDAANKGYNISCPAEKKKGSPCSKFFTGPKQYPKWLGHVSK